MAQILLQEKGKTQMKLKIETINRNLCELTYK